MKRKAEGLSMVSIKNRQPFERLDEKSKWRIAEEVRSGLIGLKPAYKKYGVPRNSIRAWISKSNLVILLNEKAVDIPYGMTESDQVKQLSIKLYELTKALEKANLKNLSLETMIEVAEENLQIKIRKNRGTKQSSE